MYVFSATYVRNPGCHVSGASFGRFIGQVNDLMSQQDKAALIGCAIDGQSLGTRHVSSLGRTSAAVCCSPVCCVWVPRSHLALSAPKNASSASTAGVLSTGLAALRESWATNRSSPFCARVGGSTGAAGMSAAAVLSSAAASQWTVWRLDSACELQTTRWTLESVHQDSLVPGASSSVRQGTSLPLIGEIDNLPTRLVYRPRIMPIAAISGRFRTMMGLIQWPRMN